jgi:hypothetical protein
MHAKMYGYLKGFQYLFTTFNFCKGKQEIMVN